MAMQLDYFYGGAAEQYSFYRIPKSLFTDGHYKSLSVEARVLYGLMLDRMGLSLRNGWLDPLKRVFIIFTLEDAIEMLGFCHTKVVRLFKELEEIGLIERKKQGQGRPTLIYVKNFTVVETTKAESPLPEKPVKKQKSRLPNNGSQDFKNPEVKTSQNLQSRLPESGSADFSKTDANNNEKNNTDFSDTDLSIYPPPPRNHNAPRPRPRVSRQDKMDEIEQCREEIKANIDYDYLCQNHQSDMSLIDGYIELMVEACCSSKEYLLIGGNKLPQEIVKTRFYSLAQEHIVYVLDCMKNSTVLIGNIKAYTLTALYNAPVTIEQYYSSLVNHDLASGYI